MSEPVVAFEEFATAFEDTSHDQLCEMFESEYGRKLAATSKKDALQEMYAVFTAGEDGADGDSTPLTAPPPPPTADDFDTPAPASPVVYEGRSRTGRKFHKMGLVFGVAWQPMGALSDDEIEQLKKFKSFITVRIRG